MSLASFVMPAKAGICVPDVRRSETPAFAGVTGT